MRLIMVPISHTADAILECLVSWSGSGLLDDFCWWPIGNETGPSVRPIVSHVAAGVRHEVRLDEVWGADAVDAAALVAFYPARRGEEFTSAFVDAVSVALSLASKVLPATSDHRPAVTLITAPGDIGQPIPVALFSGPWVACVYVAPEDRASPDAPNSLGDDRYPGHAAHALASLSDVWRASRGTHRRLQLLASRNPDPFDKTVQVARSFTRRVDFGFVISQLASRVFRPGESWPNPDYVTFERATDEQESIDYVVRRYLQHHDVVLGLSDFKALEVPKEPALRLLEAIRRLVGILLRRARDRPAQILTDAYTKAYNQTASWVERTAGPGGGFRVVRLGKNYADLDDFEDMLPDVDERPLVPTYGALGAAWEDLVALSFGLIDGSRIPNACDPESLIRDGKRIVVTAPRLIVPNPADRPAVSHAENIRACDPRSLDPKFAPQQPRQGAEESDESYASRAADWQGEMDRRTEWSEGWSNTVVWKVGASIVRQLRTAEAESPPVDKDVERHEHQEERKSSSERWKAEFKLGLRRATRALVFSSILALAALVVVSIELPVLPRVAAVLIILAAWFYQLGRVALRVVQLREAPVYEELAREIGWINESLKRALRSGDVKRLTYVYGFYLDWAEVIGWLCFRPWVGDPLRHVDVANPIDGDTLPAAFAVGRANTAAKLEDLSAAARGQLFAPGWLAAIYRSTEAHLMEVVDRRRGATTGGASTNPALDMGDDPEGARRELLIGVQRGDGRSLRESALAQELAGFVSRLRVEDLADSVSSTGDEPHLEQLNIPTAWFSPPEKLADLTEKLEPLVVRLSVRRDDGEYGGSGVFISDGLVATARHVVEGAQEIVVTYADGSHAAARLDRAAPHTDLAIISVEGASGRSARVGGAQSLRLGDPLITLGHPLLQAGGVTFAWGLVAATDRTIALDDPPAGVGQIKVIQANYASAPGASGSPVFDLDGRIVGIHVGSGGHRHTSAGVPEYLSSAVPVAEIEALISDGVATTEELDSSVDVRPLNKRDSAGEYTPLGFLTAIHASDQREFLHQHWSVLTGKPQVVDFPDLDDPPQTVYDLAEDPGFFDQINARVTSVQLTRPVPATDLASCAPPSETASGEGESAGPAIEEDAIG